MSSGIAFNNDRYAIGSTNMSQLSTIIRKEDRDYINVRDIDGATSHIKSHIQRKLYNQQSNIENFLKSASAISSGIKYQPSETGTERNIDTKRFMRVDDIEGARPINKQAVTDLQKQLIKSNDPIVDIAYQNSQYFIKQKERQGKLPFTRRVNKGTNKIDKSLVSTIDPLTGESPSNPYMNISLDRPPNERLRFGKRKLDEEGLEDNNYVNTNLVDIRAKRVVSKRSHKLGLNKNLDQNQTYTDGIGVGNQNPDYLQGKLLPDSNIRSIDASGVSKDYTKFESPGNDDNKREARLKEFYARSQRKNIGTGNRLEINQGEHRNSIDRGFTKQKAAAMDIMNISQQLDFRNVEKQKGRNFYIDGSSGSHNQSVNILNKSGQRSFNELPGLLGVKDISIINSPPKDIGKSPIDEGKRILEKSITKSNYFGTGDASINFNAIQMNPITGAISPVQSNKKGSIL